MSLCARRAKPLTWAGSFQTRRPNEESLKSRDGRREDLRLPRLLERLLECLLPSDSGFAAEFVCWRRALEIDLRFELEAGSALWGGSLRVLSLLSRRAAASGRRRRSRQA